MSVLTNLKTRTERRLERKRTAKKQATVAGMRKAIGQIASIDHLSDAQVVEAVLEANRMVSWGDKAPLPALVLRLLGLVVVPSEPVQGA